MLNFICWYYDILIYSQQQTSPLIHQITSKKCNRVLYCIKKLYCMPTIMYCAAFSLLLLPSAHILMLWHTFTGFDIISQGLTHFTRFWHIYFLMFWHINSCFDILTHFIKCFLRFYNTFSSFDTLFVSWKTFSHFDILSHVLKTSHMFWHRCTFSHFLILSPALSTLLHTFSTFSTLNQVKH